MPFINTVDINGEIYNLGNLTDGYYTVDLPKTLRKNDVFILQGDVVDSLDKDGDELHNKPLSAYQGKYLNAKIDVEIQSSADRTKTISKDLNEEISRSKDEDTKLGERIDNERDRAQSQEGVLNTKIINENERAVRIENQIKEDLFSLIDSNSYQHREFDNKISQLTTDMGTNDENTLSSAKSYTDAKDTAMGKRVKAIEDNYLKDSDKIALQDAINTEKGRMDAFMASAEIGDAAIDTLKELQDYIASDKTAATTLTNKVGSLEITVGKAAEGNNPATGLVKKVADNTTAIATNLQVAKDYTDEKIIGLGIGNYAKKSDLNNHTSNVNIHITADERTKWNAAEQNAKDYADNNFIKDENGVITKAKLAQEVLTYIDDVSTLTTNGNWTYVKMKNGTVIAWGSFTQTATLKNGLNTDLTISSTYPSGIFSQVPTCIPNLYINGGAILQYNKSAGTKTKTPELGVCFFGGSDVEVTIYSDYIVFGKWK